MLEGVSNGIGVGIADEIYIAGEIEAGRLLALLGFVASPHDFVFRGARIAKERRWICSNAG
jgi:hypothetical protein